MTVSASPLAPAKTSAQPLKRGRRARGGKIAFFFLLPFFAFFFMFTISPLVYSSVLSLFTEKASGTGFGTTVVSFVGIDNFARALSDPKFLGGFQNIAVYCLVYIPIMVTIALVIALILDAGVVRWTPFFQLSFYLPHIVPGLVAAIIWLYLYTPGVSPLVGLWESLGGEWDLGASVAGMLTVSNLAIWLNTGYNVILFFAALQSVPRETIEAAALDGAGPVRTAVQIKARMISGAVIVATLFTLVGALQLFSEPFILSDRVGAISSTWSPNMFIYHAAFENVDFGYAAASAILFAAFIGAMSWAFTRISGRITS